MICPPQNVIELKYCEPRFKKLYDSRRSQQNYNTLIFHFKQFGFSVS